MFFSDLLETTGAFSEDLLTALWNLVWSGEVSNDTLAPLRSALGGGAKRTRTFHGRTFRSRRVGPPCSEGRWSLLPVVGDASDLAKKDVEKSKKSSSPTETQRRAALANQLMERYGVVTREIVHSEGITGGFSAVYEVYKAMEEGGRIRRGYFIAGQGATQFALPGADERLRGLREDPQDEITLIISATDPANPYGAAVPWPSPSTDGGREDGKGSADVGSRAQRAAGARVILRNGVLVAWLSKGEKNLMTFLPAMEPERTHAAESIAITLSQLVSSGKRRAVFLTTIDGEPAEESAIAIHLRDVGFVQTSRGFLKRRVPASGELVADA